MPFLLYFEFLQVAEALFLKHLLTGFGRLGWWVHLAAHLPELIRHDWHCQQERQHVSNSLAGFQACETEKVGEDEQCGDVEQASAACGEQIGGEWFVDGLHHHVAQHDEWGEAESEKLPTQGGGADFHNLRIASEQGNHLFRESESANRYDKQKQGSCFHREPEASDHTVVELGTVAETAERLVAMSQSDDGCVDDEGDADNNRQASYGCVAESACHQVHRQRGDAADTLTGERWRAAREYGFQVDG